MSTATSESVKSTATAEAAAPRTVAEPRFEFGRNWTKFLRLLDDDRMRMARESLRQMLDMDSLAGKSFLYIGSGSGLFSLAAAQLEAESIVSFDYDNNSVGCTQELKRRFFPEQDNWFIDQGDCLDRSLIEALPEFDIVYSWGVLHHTGRMWEAIDHAASLVAPGGRFYTAIYNDQRWQSQVWRSIKRTYCSGPIRRALICATGMPALIGIGLISDLVNRRNPVHRYSRHNARGMSAVRDWFDWLGGYPFEVARPEEVFEFCKQRGLQLQKFKTVSGWGCNEYLFKRPL